MEKLNAIVSRFGAAAKTKLANPAATGEPEDQLRAPLERLFEDLAVLCGFKAEYFAAVGETALSTLKTRPDYAITMRKVLVGYVEVKAPERDLIHVDTVATTGSNGKSFSRCPICFTPMATPSVCGKPANSSVRSLNWMETSKNLVQNSPRRSSCFNGSTTSFAGNRFRRSLHQS